MGLYCAAVLLGGMILLHLLEWRAVPFIMKGAGSDRARARTAQRLRLAVHSEAFYYLAAFPVFHAVSNSLTGRLSVLFRVYHWGGLALLEAVGFWRRRTAWPGSMAARRMTACFIAALDLAEVIALASLSPSAVCFGFRNAVVTD